MTKNKVAFKHVNLVDRVEPAAVLYPPVPVGGVYITVKNRKGQIIDADYNRRMNDR